MVEIGLLLMRLISGGVDGCLVPLCLFIRSLLCRTTPTHITCVDFDDDPAVAVPVCAVGALPILFVAVGCRSNVNC